MGLKVSTIARLPIATDRDYFIYFLDYGWDEPLSNALHNNFDRMADFAAQHRSLVIEGLNRQEFANEVLSWHHVNGEDAENLLPAIMIADCDPRLLEQSNEFSVRRSVRTRDRAKPERFFIVPLKQVCKNPTEVAALLTQITEDIKNKRELSNFSVKKMVNRSAEGLGEMFVLKPSFAGVGIDLKKAFQFGSKYLRTLRSNNK
jgi:hypothetical protein